VNDVPQQTNPQPQAPRGRSLIAGKPVRALIPQEGVDVQKIAEMIHVSGLAPYGLKSWQAIAVVMMYGAEIGVPPMQAMAGIAVINGRPVVWGDLGMAIIRESGLVDGWKEEFTGTPYEDSFTAICRVRRKGDQLSEWHESTFSVADAKLAKLWGKTGPNGGPTPWVTHPKRMMMWRARNVFRDVFPDVTRGFRFREEAQDDIVVEDIVERSQSSGLVDRLHGAAGGQGFSDGHVERELQGGTASASEAVRATPEPPDEKNASTVEGVHGKGPSEEEVVILPDDLATDADFREVDDPAAGQPAGEGDVQIPMTDEEREDLDQLAIDLNGATSVLEVGGVWAMWAEVFTHLTEPVRLLALELVDTRKVQITEGPKRRTRKS
jgi:hypothetical protein